VLYRAAETLRWLCALLYPVMPTAAQEIWTQLGLANSPGSPATPAGIDPAKMKWGELAEGTTIGEVKPLFPRIDKSKTMAEINDSVVQSATSSVQSPADARGAGGSPAMSAEREQGSGTHATEAECGRRRSDQHGDENHRRRWSAPPKPTQWQCRRRY